MEPTTIGARLASAAIGPVVKKLFVSEGPGAGLVDKPIRISGYVSFRGEKRVLGERDVRRLAARLVRQAVRVGERPVGADEESAVSDALGSTLYALGRLDITDLDAVRLGHQRFAHELRRAADNPERHLSADGTRLYESLLDAACLHILHFFTQRSTFVAHALVEQTRSMGELIAKVDELIRRVPPPGGGDVAFEQAYLKYVAKWHGKLTIFGIDLSDSPRRWALDVAYLSLETTGPPLLPTVVREFEKTFAEAFSQLPDADEVQRFLESQRDWGDVRLQTAAWEAADAVRGVNGEVWRRLRRHTSRPADRALANAPRVLLRGEAGSGKTTLVQWLAVTAARQDLAEGMEYLDGRVPFVLPLRTLTRDGRKLPLPKDFLAAIGCPLDGTQPTGWENRVLRDGRGLILVDGIDEIPESERERARAWLRTLIETYDGDNRWLVTSRPSAVDHDWLADEGFGELALSAMDPTAIATFIRRWHAAARCGDDGDGDLDRYEAQLLRAVRTEPDLGRLATNPLMCGLICALHRDRRGYLPHGRKDLYEAALSMLLNRRDRERDMAGPELAEDPQLDVLQRLAYWLIKNGRTEMDRQRAVRIIDRELPSVPEIAALGDAAAVFDHFLERSGLLREPGPDAVDFVHRTFQDFLGARAALEEGDFGLLSANAGHDQWEDVIRMAVALARARERVTIFNSLLEAGDQAAEGRERARVYLLAAACLEHATSLDPGVREAVEQRTATLIPPGSVPEAQALAQVGPLVLRLLPGPEELQDPVDAFHVVITASRIDSDAAIAFLSRFVEHSFLAVRSQLMWAWSRYDTAQYAEEVIARLDPTGLAYTVRSNAQLDEVRRLGMRPTYLDVRTGVSLEALIAYAEEHTFTLLDLSHEDVTDLRFLAGQPGLQSLIVANCPQLTDISALDGLPLALLDLHTTAPELDLDPLGRLTALEVLAVSGPATLNWSPRQLPSGGPLKSLRIAGEVAPAHGLQGLADLPHLMTLALNAASGPASAADWAELRQLPHLTELTTTAVSLETAPAGEGLPGITHVTLVGGDGDRVVQAAAHRLPDLFPGLTHCEFSGDMHAEGDIDLSPLAGLRGLRTLMIDISRDRVRGVDALPASVDLHLA
ncbi:NACHT domain-containing protein [Streptomyces endophyticus]|uniref:NACHT domain-containing protein n=1 Tax=Streptomyces endophyticus TaxID=714166 RepID=A0ABU6FDH0_9ACTN|nr:NACHT domain-containing protein [Streptomyces endophyticus]MEB8341884.1 NACHT domain-containing protein [Streptomyces endophyticus]